MYVLPTYNVHSLAVVYIHTLQVWCRENYIHQRNMRTALSVRAQLRELCGRHGVALVSNGDSRAVRRALLRGLHTQTAENAGEGKYHTVCHHNCCS